jgi:hypothetical protein
MTVRRYVQASQVSDQHQPIMIAITATAQHRSVFAVVCFGRCTSTNVNKSVTQQIVVDMAPWNAAKAKVRPGLSWPVCISV